MTLITGDTVVVGDGRPATVRLGAGRTGISFAVRRTGNDLDVIPSDARTLIAQGHVDRRLFDVTALAAAGDDDRRADLPLVLSGPAAQAAQRAGRTGPGITVVGQVPGGMAVRVAKVQLVSVWKALASGLGAVPAAGAQPEIRLDKPVGPAVKAGPAGTDPTGDTFDVTFSILDRTGTPTSAAFITLINLDTQEQFQPLDQDGTATVWVPEGRYAATASISTPGDGDALVVEPEFALHGPTARTLDARVAKPLVVAVPDKDATPVDVQVEAIFTTGDHRTTVGGDIVFGTGIRGPYFGQPVANGSTVGLVTWVDAQFARVGSDGTTLDSPYLYHLAWTAQDNLPTGLKANLTRRDLATVHAGYAGQGPPTAVNTYFVEPPVDLAIAFGNQLPTRLPSDRVEYYSAALRWQTVLSEGKLGNESVILESPATAYQSGTISTERRNGAVFGPGFPAGVISEPWAARSGDDLLLGPPLFVDHAGWDGFVQPHATTAAFQFRLYRDGELLADLPTDAAGLPVPPDAAEYRLEIHATRHAPSMVSTDVTVAWTFRSGSGDVVLPMSAVRLLPDLDSHNTAPANRPFTVPFVVQRQTGSGPGSVANVAIDVSYDDGATWHPTTVVRDGATGTVRLIHPAEAGFVSLRATATDDAANTVTETIIRAYRIA